jgi:hypothetical protein
MVGSWSSGQAWSRSSGPPRRANPPRASPPIGLQGRESAAARKAGLDPDSGEVSEAIAALMDRGYVQGTNILGQKVYRITASGIEETTRPA